MSICVMLSMAATFGAYASATTDGTFCGTRPASSVELSSWPGTEVATWPGTEVATWPGTEVTTWPGSELASWPGTELATWPDIEVLS